MSNQSKKDEFVEVSYGTPTLNDWKLYFRNSQQVPTLHRQATPVSSEESSFELEESFQALLDRKRQELQEKAPQENMLSEDEADSTGEGVEGADRPNFITSNDSTFLEQDSMSKLSDTSFEAMEIMCDVLDRASRLCIGGPATDQQEQKSTAGVSQTFGNITQLEDVDEPSGLWENTILPGSGQMLSPVKRMHLLRPSTIIEETTVNDVGGSKNSSSESFESAKQSESQEAEGRNSALSGSDVYRTAEETFVTDSYARGSAMESGLIYDSTSSELQKSYEQQHEAESAYSKNSTAEAGLIDEHDVIILDSSQSETEGDDEKDQQEYALRDPPQTKSRTKDESFQGKSSILDDFEESVDDSSNLSGLEEMPDRFNDTLEETDFMMKRGMKLMALKRKEEQQKEHREIQQNQLYESLATEQQKSRANSESDDGASDIRHMMHTPAKKDICKESKGSSFSYLTPSSGAVKCKLNVSHGTGSGYKQTLFSSVGKNITKKYPAPPSGDVACSGGPFKKPVISRVPHLKAVRKFDHIMSPIGAYIKKTPQSMLQRKINCPNKNLIDVLHSENRDSVMSNRASKENYQGSSINVKEYTPSLPGKGVISSNRAHVLDERVPFRMPGGDKLQKLINNSPTMVIRHEGRIRYARESAAAGRKLAMDNSTIGEDSLKDISVASNDVSVRVLHDAKRF